MLDSIKRWLGHGRAPRRTWPEQAAWAQANQWTVRGVREAEGFVLDGRSGAHAWRMEWGPSQRPYIQGHELRLRAEIDVPRELQALVLDRGLMESLEKSVFDQYVEGLQTRIDTGTPAEMRWLVMYPKLGSAELKSLRDGWGALGSFKPWLLQWLDGPLAQALTALRKEAGQPVVMMVARRRLSLRTALAEPDVPSLKRWQALFDCALHQVQRVTVDYTDAATPSTQPSLFPSSTLSAEGARH